MEVPGVDRPGVDEKSEDWRDEGGYAVEEDEAEDSGREARDRWRGRDLCRVFRDGRAWCGIGCCVGIE